VSFFHSPGLSLRESSLQTRNPPFLSTEENPFDKARRERRRALILPREHGAWGLLLVPMVTGVGVAFHQASHVFPLILFLTAALALFWLRTPLESCLGTSAMRAQTLEESHILRSAIVLLAGIAAVTLAALLWAGRNAVLWPLGAAVAAAFIGQALLKKAGRRTRMLSEMVGTIGLTASAPASY
jgi:YwiC-like protein